MRAVALRVQGGAVLLEVIVTPGARRTRLLDPDPWRSGVRIAVAARAEKGKANDELVRFLAERLGVPERGVSILRGATSRSKTIRVEGASADIVQARLSEEAR